MILFIDCETSGPSPFQNQLLSFGATTIDGDRTFEGFVKPSEIIWGTTARSYFSAYEAAWTMNSITAEEFANNLNSFFESLSANEITLSGYNVGFDYYFLLKLFSDAQVKINPKISHRTLDLHSLTYLAFQKNKISLNSFSSDSAFSLLKNRSEFRARHTALEDAKLAAELYKFIEAAL